MHPANSFLTLTYDDEHLPHGGVLELRDWQLFAKRVRKAGLPFRYFVCGEYGDKNGRPHYHACMFGQDFSADRDLVEVRDGQPMYKSAMLNELWGLGNCMIGTLTFESAAYVARYVMKKRTGPEAAEAYEVVNPFTGEVEFELPPPFATMSRRPGLGRDWLAKYQHETYRDDFIVSQGHRCTVPRAYDRVFEVEEPERFATVKARRVERAASHARNNTPRRLEVRRAVAEARTKALVRDL